MKKIRMWVELIYIFLLPLLFIGLSIKLETTKEYDENNNEVSKESYINWEYPYNDFKSNEHYINHLKYNMLINGFNNQTYYYEELTNNKIKVLNYITGGSAISYLNLSIPENHKIYMYYESEFQPISQGTSLFIYWYTGTLYTGISYAQNYYYDYYSNGNLSNEINIRLDNQDYIDKTITLYVFDITEMFGNGYEPQTKQELDTILNSLDINKNDYIEELILNYYSENTNISKNWSYNYTTWGELYNNVIINNLYLNDNVTTRFILTYIITWFIMFITFHIFYLPFDRLLHLFEKE